MKKGINLYLTKLYEENTLLEMFSKAGFDSVLLPVEFVEKHGYKTMEILRNYNLAYQMIHCRYDSDWLDEFWLEGNEKGNLLYESYKAQLDSIAHLAPVDFVIHLANTKEVRYTKFGESRLKTLVEKASKLGIRICLENTYSTTQQKAVFDNINSENLVMCYDCGHENWLTPNDDLLEMFKNKITQTHIHNNNGSGDQHQPIEYGTINWEAKAQKLAGLTHDVDLCLEVKFIDDKFSEEYLKKLKGDLDYLESLIIKYKNKK